MQSVYTSAFSQDAKACVKPVTLITTNTKGYASETLTDQYVFPLSYNSGSYTDNYGINTYRNNVANAMIGYETDFSSYTYDDNGKGSWHLRTGHISTSYKCYMVGSTGFSDYVEDEYYDIGSRPACVFQIPQV